MKHLLAVCVLGLAMVVEPVLAMPRGPAIDPPQVDNGLVVKVATAYQRKVARRACRAQYGSRLVSVIFKGNTYRCQYLKSKKQLSKEARRECRKDGYRSASVTRVKKTGKKYRYYYYCTRRR